MNKPVLFQAAFLSGTWGTITQAPDVTPQEKKTYLKRTHTYNYMGDNVRFCIHNDKKRCNICGACFPAQEIKE
jgi:hypothetical protein